MKKYIALFLILFAINTSAKELSLQQCIDIALENNADLMSARLNHESSLAKLKESRSSYFPQISGNFSASRSVSPLSTTFGAGDFTIPGISNTLDVTTYRAGLLMQQNIWDFGRTLSLERRAYLNENIAMINTEKKGFEIRSQVKKSYYSFLQSKSLETIAKVNLKEMEFLFDSVKEKKNQGLATAVDVLNAEAQYHDFKLQLYKAANQIEIAKASLLNLLGLPDTEDFNTKDCSFAVPDKFPFNFKNYEECKNYAVKNKIEFKELDCQYDIAKANVSASDSEWFPVISGQAGYDLTDNTLALKSGSWQVGLNISVPLFNGFGKEAKQDWANSELKNIEFLKKQITQNILLQIKTNYSKVLEEQENIEVVRKKTEYCRKNHEAALAKYEQGLSTLNDLIEAQAKKSNAEIEMQQSIYLYYIALGELEYSIGGIK